MSIATYFSHSYRLANQDLNKFFWSLFSADFSFFVDPPSDATIDTHLERMMRRCSAFVAVVNRREGVSRLRCSPFVLYEYGLSVQARRPKLLLIDDNLSATRFENLDPQETHFFSANDPKAKLDELIKKIDRLKGIAKAYPDALHRPRGKIAVIVPRDASGCAYAKDDVLKRISETAKLRDFEIHIVKLPHEYNTSFALELDKYEAIILDVRGKDLPEWVFPYIYGRLVPTIKLARLELDEVLGSAALPPIVEGLRMDPDEPAVESVLYWRDTEDLIWQLDRAFKKMDEGDAAFKKGQEGVLYFESIGRRPARVFISNSAKANPLARRLSEELRLRNIDRFHYKEPNAIWSGSNWQEKLRSEVAACDVFVAIIGEGYEQSEWSREEFRLAIGRKSKIVLLPYSIAGADLKFLKQEGAEQLHVAELSATEDDAIDLILGNIYRELTSVGRGENSRAPRTKMLGGSREAIIDTIRHIPKPEWAKFLARLSNDDIAVSAAPDDQGPVRSRAVAEQIFADAQSADTNPDQKSTMATLVGALVGAAPSSHQDLIERVAGRIEADANNASL
ncbi:MAG: hypothetical protein QOD09_2937 [Bradyrhizobium sp.]|jgi:hypothetical protein|nr:hypothetical protein [Bradyrhizobium sp.]